MHRAAIKRFVGALARDVARLLLACVVLLACYEAWYGYQPSYAPAPLPMPAAGPDFVPPPAPERHVKPPAPFVPLFPELGDDQRTALDTALGEIAPGRVLLSCPDNYCTPLEADLVWLFKGRGWAIEEYPGLGRLRDSRKLIGIRLSGCGAAAVKAALEKALPYRIAADESCPGDATSTAPGEQNGKIIIVFGQAKS